MRQLFFNFQFIVALSFFSTESHAQSVTHDIGFYTDQMILNKNWRSDTTILIPFNLSFSNSLNPKNFTVSIVVDTRQLNLPSYIFDFVPSSFNDLTIKEHTINVTKLVLGVDSSLVDGEIIVKMAITENGKTIDENRAPDSKNFRVLKIKLKSSKSITTNVVNGNKSNSNDTLSTEEKAALNNLKLGEKKPKIERLKEDKIYALHIDAKGLGALKLDSALEVKVVVDAEKTSIAKANYQIDYAEKFLYELDRKDSVNNPIYLSIAKDSLTDRDRILVLQTEVWKDGKKLELESLNKRRDTIAIKGIRLSDTLKAYSYLAYLGTNFDLVEGSRPNNLFFATNVFLPPYKGKGVGMYLSLYGNRTMSSVDTVSGIRSFTRAVTLSDSTYKLFTNQYDLTRTEVSDNLGSYISSMIRLGGASSGSNRIQMYFSPSLEFVWRRTTSKSVFRSTGSVDSTIETGIFSGRINELSDATTKLNEFVFNMGFFGLLVVHENEDISVRVHCTAGKSSTYRSNIGNSKASNYFASDYGTYNDWFFSGRAWITEPTTGITLQAEVTNNFNIARPYYGVTLSKAFNFKNLGNIFKPIVPSK